MAVVSADKRPKFWLDRKEVRGGLGKEGGGSGLGMRETI